MVFGDNVFSKIILKSYVFGKIHILALTVIKVLNNFEAEGRLKVILLQQVSNHDFEATFIIFCLN